MRKPSELLDRLYTKYNITLSQTQHGAISDRLGDLYEEYILEMFKDIKHMLIYSDTERYPQESEIILKILDSVGICRSDIHDVNSSSYSGTTDHGGPPKTDVYIDIHYYSNYGEQNKLIPLNIKHSSESKVSIAEYDVETICTKIGIPNGDLKNLMLKHQHDASAKNFTLEEKNKLTALLHPYREKLIRWCITLNPNESQHNIEHPDLLVRFNVRNCKYNGVNIQTINDYIKEKITAGNKPNHPGFGTGLSWTYATGSKGKKIQFKG